MTLYLGKMMKMYLQTVISRKTYRIHWSEARILIYICTKMSQINNTALYTFYQHIIQFTWMA
jgi:hypothetical protein